MTCFSAAENAIADSLFCKTDENANRARILPPDAKRRLRNANRPLRSVASPWEQPSDECPEREVSAGEVRAAARMRERADPTANAAAVRVGTTQKATFDTANEEAFAAIEAFAIVEVVCRMAWVTPTVGENRGCELYLDLAKIQIFLFLQKRILMHIELTHFLI